MAKKINITEHVLNNVKNSLKNNKDINYADISRIVLLAQTYEIDSDEYNDIQLKAYSILETIVGFNFECLIEASKVEFKKIEDKRIAWSTIMQGSRYKMPYSDLIKH